MFLKDIMLSHLGGRCARVSGRDSICSPFWSASIGVPIVIEVMQARVSVRMYLLMGTGPQAPRCENDQGLGEHASRGDTSFLWAVAPDCVDRCLEHRPMPFY